MENTEFNDVINTKLSLLEENYYLIDSGDVIKINFLTAEELNNDYLVMSDGYIYLPFVKPVFLRGLTINETRSKLEEAFSEELLVPNLNISLSKRRPLKISLIGEVQKPGLHILKSSENLITEKQFEMKTVLDAIQQAGGITQEANLRNVELIRKLPGPEASYKTTQLDLADLILNGNQVFNPYLFDGDILKIKKADLYKEEIVKLSQSTIAPSEIKVDVIGKVNNPGQISLKPNSSFTQAVMRAGGLKALEANRNNIQLIRINSNGTMTSRRFFWVKIQNQFLRKIILCYLTGISLLLILVHFKKYLLG